jgi:hypothetical protein
MADDNLNRQVNLSPLDAHVIRAALQEYQNVILHRIEMREAKGHPVVHLDGTLDRIDSLLTDRLPKTTGDLSLAFFTEQR